VLWAFWLLLAIANDEDEASKKVHRPRTSNIDENHKFGVGSSENSGKDLRLENGGDMKEV